MESQFQLHIPSPLPATFTDHCSLPLPPLLPSLDVCPFHSLFKASPCNLNPSPIHKAHNHITMAAILSFNSSFLFLFLQIYIQQSSSNYICVSFAGLETHCSSPENHGIPLLQNKIHRRRALCPCLLTVEPSRCFPCRRRHYHQPFITGAVDFASVQLQFISCNIKFHQPQTTISNHELLFHLKTSPCSHLDTTGKAQRRRRCFVPHR